MYLPKSGTFWSRVPLRSESLRLGTSSSSSFRQGDPSADGLKGTTKAITATATTTNRHWTEGNPPCRGESKQHKRTKQRTTMWEVDSAWKQMLVGLMLYAATCFGVWGAVKMLMMEEERERRRTHRIMSPLFEQYLEEAVTRGGGPRNPTTGDLPLRTPGVRAGSRQGTRTSASSAAPTRTGSASRQESRASNMDNTRPPPASQPTLTSARSRVRTSSARLRVKKTSATRGIRQKPGGRPRQHATRLAVHKVN